MGLFDPLKDELNQVRAGFEKAVAAEVVSHVARSVEVECLAAQPDQGQDELEDQHGSADRGTDNKYCRHSISPEQGG